ncbi:MAG: exopolyphosphatase [Bacteroidia bacterium]|jgi:exopolyphosphatase/guanosine-5'-triphosphate,3'-diphosphate pyrophosphatase|nr:exopolyphosphatase [Bacteroidia bacterium]
MRVAIIDLGTNTFNLVVAETGSGAHYTIIYNEKVPVKLGEGGINQGYIADPAFERGLNAIRNYATVIRSLHTDKTRAFATSAVRNAANGKAFTDAVETETGIHIEIISGNREAEYIYMGVKQAVQLHPAPSLIMDIGGGSTEFIIADDEGIRWKHSFEVGAARLLDTFHPSDPLTAGEQEKITAYLRHTLKPLFEAAALHCPQELIGASGSFDSLAEMVAWEFHTPAAIEGVSDYTFNPDEVAFIHRRLLQSTKAERLQMKGLVTMRVDMIVVSTLLVETVLRETGLSHIRLSTYALKEGALWDTITQM